jgi:hypothetical protein
MTATLLDINILIALLDPVHIRHNLVHDWFARQVGKLWASCPITQNGYIRIVSQQRYPNPLPIGAAVSLLAGLYFSPDRFWVFPWSLCVSPSGHGFIPAGLGQSTWRHSGNLGFKTKSCRHRKRSRPFAYSVVSGLIILGRTSAPSLLRLHQHRFAD